MNKKQIEIEVDCNSDIITIFEDNRAVFTVANIRHPITFIKFFSELFNRLINEDRDINHISITKVDEDHKSTEEEW